MKIVLKQISFSALALAMSVSVSAEELVSEKDRLSYMIGMDVGNSLRQFSEDIDLKVFLRAVEDVLEERDLALTSEQAAKIKQEFIKNRQQKRMAEKQQKSAEARAAGTEYLAVNGKKAGVMTTESGLQYEELSAGDGAKPKETDRVKVHYRGTLIDGTEFDSSYKRGQPATFALNGVIKGWTEGLQLMNAGSKFRFVIPSELAYGEKGTSGPIGPGSTLIFEVELISIEE